MRQVHIHESIKTVFYVQPVYAARGFSTSMCLPDKTATNGENVKATYCSYIPKTGSCASMHPPDTVHPNPGSCASMHPPDTVHPNPGSCASMHPPDTVHPVHKKRAPEGALIYHQVLLRKCVIGNHHYGRLQLRQCLQLMESCMEGFHQHPL